MSEQTRIAEELEQRVAERTRELAEANDALKWELAVERRRTEAARHASDYDSLLAVGSIPGLFSILTPTGGLEAVNDQLVEYCGRTLEELQQWRTSDLVHPDDLPRVIQIFTQANRVRLTVQDVGVASSPTSWTSSFKPSSPPRAVAWASDCPSAVPSSKSMVVACGVNRMTGPALRLRFPFPAIQDARQTRHAS